MGTSVAAVTAATTPPVDAAPPTQAWLLGGNAGVGGDNFLGTTTKAPLIIKTAPRADNPVERVRINANGTVWVRQNMGVGTAPLTTARLAAATTDVVGAAIEGSAPNSLFDAPDATGVRGVGSVGVKGIGDNVGVWGASSNVCVVGEGGVIGVAASGSQSGVTARCDHGSAVLGNTDDGVAIMGQSSADGDTVTAVRGLAWGADNVGVVGEAISVAGGFGVWGISPHGYAGVFSGDVQVSGALSKAGGSFRIDHPLDPRNSYLSHSFVESPDMMNVYNGNVTTDDEGVATVVMPDYFEALNRDFRYQLTVVDDGAGFARAVVRSKLARGRFVVATDQPRTEVSWQVTGVRQDAWAERNRIPVTEPKPPGERGTYLHPEAFGRPTSAGPLHDRIAGLRRGPADHPVVR